MSHKQMSGLGLWQILGSCGNSQSPEGRILRPRESGSARQSQESQVLLFVFLGCFFVVFLILLREAEAAGPGLRRKDAQRSTPARSSILVEIPGSLGTTSCGCELLIIYICKNLRRRGGKSPCSLPSSMDGQPTALCHSLETGKHGQGDGLRGAGVDSEMQRTPSLVFPRRPRTICSR